MGQTPRQRQTGERPHTLWTGLPDIDPHAHPSESSVTQTLWREATG